MTVHLIKLAVGVDSVTHLGEIQARRLAEARRRGSSPVLRHFTRHAPKREAELVEGGSMYWVIKGLIQVRQAILGVERAVNSRGEPCCALILSPDLVRTRPRPHRPFQGWRYLRPEDAPPDFGPAEAGGDIPDKMAVELKDLGLL